MSWMIFSSKDQEILSLEFRNSFDEAIEEADKMVMEIQGVNDEMPDWYENAKYDLSGINVEIVDLNNPVPNS
jgi:phosphoribosylaminoimidazole (AIR) synthetase